MPRKDQPGPITAQAQQDLVSEGLDNFELPKSLVTKIAKSNLPDNTKLQKETILALVKGSTVFINYLAATAHDVAQSKQHKSISASDVLKALELLEFGDLVDPFQAELTTLLVFRDQGKRKSSGSASVSTSKGAKASSGSTSKSKGKEKAAASASAQGPFTSAPLATAAGDSISANPMAIDVEEVNRDRGDDENAEVDGGDDPMEEDEVEETVDVNGQSTDRPPSEQADGTKNTDGTNV
ncbi:cbf nf-y family transcription [Moniliophthora roreri MCA 2997]|uniref:DNA polymerase epsilon subunit D n=1 Tax=Moniliophthora roreri (strain MCA 2997) TaxID=1381753 RepID=V2YNT6_MONRO|nr:cbf nf-y family transcription [Moniliophthora roreri MCA 2997]